jgi:hypothetical protein
MDTPQLPFDLILTILNERKNMKRDERIERESKERYDNIISIINYIGDELDAVENIITDSEKYDFIFELIDDQEY